MFRGVGQVQKEPHRYQWPVSLPLLTPQPGIAGLLLPSVGVGGTLVCIWRAEVPAGLAGTFPVAVSGSGSQQVLPAVLNLCGMASREILAAGKPSNTAHCAVTEHLSLVPGNAIDT